MCFLQRKIICSLCFLQTVTNFTSDLWEHSGVMQSCPVTSTAVVRGSCLAQNRRLGFTSAAELFPSPRVCLRLIRVRDAGCLQQGWRCALGCGEEFAGGWPRGLRGLSPPASAPRREGSRAVLRAHLHGRLLWRGEGRPTPNHFHLLP